MDPTIKVTRIGKVWGIRCLNPSGSIFLETTVKDRTMIGPTARHMLRMYDKCSFEKSHYASRARHRAWEKAREADNVIDRDLRNADMRLR
jgi:hypothetical protein